MRPFELAQHLRAHYGRAGKVVYDRLDRWIAEHRAPGNGHIHELKPEGCIIVEHCPDYDAVLVVDQDSIAGSKCTSCNEPVPPSELLEFLKRDHQCKSCGLEWDDGWTRKEAENAVDRIQPQSRVGSGE